MRAKCSEGGDSLQAGKSADAVGALNVKAHSRVLVAMPFVSLEALATMAVVYGNSGESRKRGGRRGWRAAGGRRGELAQGEEGRERPSAGGQCLRLRCVWIRGSWERRDVDGRGTVVGSPVGRRR